MSLISIEVDTPLSSGLKDKNGEVIVEGHILLDNWVVVHEEGEFYAVDAYNADLRHKLADLLSVGNIYRIIGHIYD